MPYTPLEMARAFVQAGELPDAVVALNQHLEADPRDDSARRLRAQVLLRLRDSESLRVAVNDYTALAVPDVNDVISHAVALQYLGADDEALAVLLDGRDQFADDLLTESLLVALMRTRRFAEARTLLDTLPRTWRWLSWSGDLASEYEGEAVAQREYTAALEALGSVFDPETDPMVRNTQAHLLAERARMAWQLGDFPAAAADYAAAQAIVPDDPMLTFNRGLIASDLGDLIEGVALCGEALGTTSAHFHDHMVNVLKTNPRYAGLGAILLEGE